MEMPTKEEMEAAADEMMKSERMEKAKAMMRKKRMSRGKKFMSMMAEGPGGEA